MERKNLTTRNYPVKGFTINTTMGKELAELLEPFVTSIKFGKLWKGDSLYVQFNIHSWYTIKDIINEFQDVHPNSIDSCTIADYSDYDYEERMYIDYILYNIRTGGWTEFADKTLRSATIAQNVENPFHD